MLSEERVLFLALAFVIIVSLFVEVQSNLRIKNAPVITAGIQDIQESLALRCPELKDMVGISAQDGLINSEYTIFKEECNKVYSVRLTQALIK